MTTIASTALTNRSSLLRLSVTGGLITSMLHLFVQLGLVAGLMFKVPFISSMQYVASGVMGEAAYAGGLATAVLGLILELAMMIIIAGIFILGTERIPLLRRYVIPGSLLYGLGVFVVMNFIVQPLSAAAALPVPPLWLLIEVILEHALLVGLPLGILVWRNANANP